MSFQDTDIYESGEDDSIARQTYAEGVIQDIVQQSDNLPHQLPKVANAILETSSGLNSVKNHKKDFEPLLDNGSNSLVIFWQFYIEAKIKDPSPSLDWPPPELSDLLDVLVDTTRRIHKFMGRKSEKNLTKRVLSSRFGIRDLGKLSKYQKKLDFVASGLQSKSPKTNIHEVLQAVVPSRAQPQDEDSDSKLERGGELVEGDFPDKKSAKKAANKEPTAEGSRLREVGRPTTFKPANQRVKSEEDSQRSSEDSDSELGGEVVEGDLPDKKSAKKKAADKEPTAEGSYLREVGVLTKVKPANQRAKSGEDSPRKSSKAKNEAKDNSKHERDEEGSAEDKPARRVYSRRTNCDEDAQEKQDRSKTMKYEPNDADLVEGTSAQGSRSNNTAQLKTRKKPSQAHGDEKNIRDTAPKRISRSRTNPVSPPQTSGPSPMRSFSFTNGSGFMVNEGIGNTYNY